MAPTKLYYLNRTSSEENFWVNEKNTDDLQSASTPALLPMQPGKGLNIFAARLSKFCRSPSNSPIYAIPKASIIPQRKPDHHRLSFVDDPPYSITIGRDFLRQYQIPKCKCHKQTPDGNCTGNSDKGKSKNFVLLRDELPKWIRASNSTK